LRQIFYSIRGERVLMEQLGYNLLFRWFVGEDIRTDLGADGVHEQSRALAQ
jgi:transposase